MGARRSLLAGTVVVWVGCTPAPAPVDPSAAAPEPPGVVVVVRGSAFAAPAARDEAASVAHEQTGRPVRTIGDEPPVDRVIQQSGTRTERTVARAARAEARNGGCQKKGRPFATALAERADTIVRVRLDAKTTARPATDAERKELAASRLAGVLSSVGLGDDTVYETKLDGTVERTTFPGSPTTARQRVRWSGRRLGSKDAPPPPSVREAMTKALAAMPAPTPARWDQIARTLVSGGCPVLGAAVADTFLEDGAPKRRIRAAAVAALGPTPPGTTPGAETPAPDPEPAPTEIVSSCSSLCTLHMVELCNNDRALWTQNGARWENTRCGVRRSEGFLENCYRMQWLSGTYEQSCIHPCERGDDGRARLLAMLRRAGCVRGDS